MNEEERINTTQSLRNRYSELESRYKPHGFNQGTYNTPVNFRESLSVPIHRWYGYKEGFSPSFVHEFIQTFSSGKDVVVFDPFGGVGTTALEANIMGHNAYLMDVNPLGLFASGVKTHKYSKEELNSVQKDLNEFSGTEDFNITISIPNTTIPGYFDPLTWDSVLKMKSYAARLKNSLSRDLFNLSILSLIDEISTHHKNGNGVKKKAKIPAPLNEIELRDKICDKISLFIVDASSINRLGSTSIIAQSNLIPYTLPEKVDIVLTSPPYANCFDYSKVYLTELWLGGFFNEKADQTAFRENSVISHVHYKWNRQYKSSASDILNECAIPLLEPQKLWSNNIIPMLKGYFSDMSQSLTNLSLNLNDGATVGIVVGNSVYGGVVIATDLLLTSIAEQIGFKCKEIKVYRKVIASSQQMAILSTKDKELVRESLIILTWK